MKFGICKWVFDSENENFPLLSGVEGSHTFLFINDAKLRTQKLITTNDETLKAQTEIFPLTTTATMKILTDDV